ncbi:hypothetical protein P9112_006158 [Eukaryota sp. TZLM1-RC]
MIKWNIREEVYMLYVTFVTDSSTPFSVRWQNISWPNAVDFVKICPNLEKLTEGSCNPSYPVEINAIRTFFGLSALDETAPTSPRQRLPSSNIHTPQQNIYVESSSPPRKKTKRQMTMKEFFALQLCEAKNKQDFLESVYFKIAQFVAATGLPISIVDNPEFRELLTLVSSSNYQYEPVCSKTIKTKHLPLVESELKKELNVYLDTIKVSECYISTDAWTNTNKTGFLNVMLNALAGQFFYDAFDLTSQKKDAMFIADQIDNVIQIIKAKYVRFIITNNGSEFIKAGRILLEKYKQYGLVWIPCAAHTIDLALLDVEKTVLPIRNLTSGQKDGKICKRSQTVSRYT